MFYYVFVLFFFALHYIYDPFQGAKEIINLGKLLQETSQT